MKDRMALAVIARAEADGRLRSPEEPSSSTPAGAPARRSRWCAPPKATASSIVSSDAFSREKLDQMAALGAELTLVPSEGGRTTKKLILDMIEAARG